MAQFHKADATACSRRDFFRLRAPDALHGQAREPRLIRNCLETQGVTCRACQSACDAEAIRFRPIGSGRALFHIDPAKCSGCGACVTPCPIGALSLAPVSAEA